VGSLGQRWRSARFRLPRQRLDEVAALLSRLGSLGFEERAPDGGDLPFRQPWDAPDLSPPSAELEILAWFDFDEREEARLERQHLLATGLGPQVACSWDTVEEGSWPERWRTGFKPFEIGPGDVVAAPWNAPAGALVIEPGMAFGTGDHPTTRACLRAIRRFARPGERMLDAGCGSGILALYAARRGMAAEGVDIDPPAVRAARENAARNGLAVRFDQRLLAAIDGPFHLVVGNLFAEEIARVARDLARLTGVRLVLAGILADREALVLAAFPDLALEEREQDGEWVSQVWLKPPLGPSRPEEPPLPTR
jgi:ribosomal protein L11 methyltransferase